VTVRPPRTPPEPPGLAAWLRADPPRRVPPALAVGTLAAGEACALVGASWYYPAAGTVLAAAIAAGAALARGRRRLALPGRRPPAGFGPGEVTVVAVTAGAWVTAAAATAGDWRLLFALPPGWWAGRRWLAAHPVMAERAAAEAAARAAAAKEAAWEARKAWWRDWAPGVDLAGTYALDYTSTLLGDHWVIDYGSAGLLASSLSLPAVEELWAQREQLTAGRVTASIDRRQPAGKNLHIHVRRADPWAEPFYHPAAHPGSEFAGLVPDTATCTVPQVIGLDPETASPLPLALWDDYGGKVILILASPGGGKTVLLNCITERLTACVDALVIQLNLAKPREDAMWAPACALSILGGDGDETARARRALAWVVGELTWRARNLNDASKVRPSREVPLIVVKADELPALRRDWVCRQLLDQIGELRRSEAVTLVAAAQTRRSEHVGSLLRALADVTVSGRFTSDAEARRAADGAPIPLMTDYGDGHRGVAAVLALGDGDVWLGRTWLLEHPPDIAAIARRRAHRVRPPAHRTRELAGLWAEAAGTAPITPRWPDEVAEHRAAARAGVRDQATAAVPGFGTEPGHTAAVPGAAPGPVPGSPGGPVPGPGQVRDRVADVLASVEHDGPGLAPLDPDAAARYQAGRDARRAEYLAATFGAVEVPADMVLPLLGLLARPGGVSSRESARVLLGDEKHRMTTLGWIKKLEALGWAVLVGTGPKQGYQLTDAGRAQLASAAPAGDSR